MRSILHEALRVLAAGKTAALSTIVSARGSLPMSRRSKMLVLPDGTLRGTVGGGCLEAEVHERGIAVLESGRAPVLNRFVLTEKQAGAEGLNCGGTVEILTEPLVPGPVEAVLASVLETIDGRQEGILLTAVDGPSDGAAGKMLVRRTGARVGSLGPGRDEAAETFARPLLGSAVLRLEDLPGAGRVFVEAVEVVPTVVLFGGGHVSREVARVAKVAGFRVVVVDDRAAFASPERHPEADETLVLPFDGVTASLAVDDQTFLVAVTRGHEHDEMVVRQALRTGAAYVGMIGSGRKVALLRRKLAADGYSKEDLSRLHAPIGLDIGADTPAEIAVSIVAELIAVRRSGGSQASLSLAGRLRV